MLTKLRKLLKGREMTLSTLPIIKAQAVLARDSAEYFLACFNLTDNPIYQDLAEIELAQKETYDGVIEEIETIIF